MKNINLTEIVECLNQNSIQVQVSLELNILFKSIQSISNAENNDLSFFSNDKYLNHLKKIKASACLIRKEHVNHLPENCLPIIVEEPYLAFAALSKLFSDTEKKSNGIISKLSSISKECIIGENVQIDPFCILESNTKIFDNVCIGANSKIGPNVEIYNNCIIHDNVSISNAKIMENSEIHSGARIGKSGFGFEEKTKEKIYHHGNVIIGKNCTIGSNTTVDRAVLNSTIIGEYSQIDNLVQIAHNVTIGKHAIIAAQVGIAGSTNLGNNVKIGGQSGIAGHLNIGNDVVIAGKSGVTKNIKDNDIVAGFPAKNIQLWKRDVIKLSKLK